MIRFKCFPILLLLSLSGTVSGLEEILLNPAQVKALGIETVAVGERDNAKLATLPAQVLVPNHQLRVIAAPISGMIDMLAVAPGDSVRKGQVLAHLASPQALELQRDAIQASSQAALQQQNLQRDEQLFAEGLIAESRLQATRAAASQAAAQVSERRQGLALAGIAPGKLGGFLALTAAIDGVVLEQGAQLGERVEAATPIYRIGRLSPLWLEIQAPVALAATLRLGMAVGMPSVGSSGKLISIGRAVDAGSQTVLLRALVTKGAEQLRPGQVTEVEILGLSAKGKRLPASAVVRHDNKPLAFVQTAGDDRSSRFEPRQIRLISQSSDTVVVDGINPGERIANKGVSALKAMLTGVGKE